MVFWDGVSMFRGGTRALRVGSESVYEWDGVCRGRESLVVGVRVLKSGVIVFRCGTWVSRGGQRFKINLLSYQRN